MSNNTTTITGNLTREPEIRYTKEGQATTQLGVAVNRRWQDRATQEWQEATSFFDVVCWRDLAENVPSHFPRGCEWWSRAAWSSAVGRRTRVSTRSKVEITADEIGPSLLFATADVWRTERRQGISETESDVSS
jgi:single-strand DNA-binding protein